MARVTNPANTMISPRPYEYGVLSLIPEVREPLVSTRCHTTEGGLITVGRSVLLHVYLSWCIHQAQYHAVHASDRITGMDTRDTEVMEHHPLHEYPP